MLEPKIVLITHRSSSLLTARNHLHLGQNHENKRLKNLLNAKTKTQIAANHADTSKASNLLH